MQRIIKSIILLSAVMLSADAYAQLSSNQDKFLGNITTGWPGSMDWDGFKYSDYWNQVTPENGTKWGTVQGGGKNSYSWTGADNAFRYAQQHGFPFKFHCLVWGSQYPNWITSLSPEERYQAIVNWMDAAKKKYPDLQMIDVVNEAMNGHQNDTYLMSEALGGAGETGYDWIIKAFELAHERWPNAILIYNDYNVLRWGVDEFIGLVGTLRDAGAPIDAYGCQAHSFTLNECSKSELQTNLKRIQDALKIPMYITEYDINYANDAQQETKYKEQIPLFWEADYCAGVTLWGWFVGQTWEDNTGLIKNKQERAALQWLREYMQTDAAKNAKSPFPGMVKEASLYVKPQALRVAAGEPVPIEVNAAMRTKSIHANDAQQETKYKEQIPLFWEADYCAGVTLWGWFVGQTWEDNTGLIKNKQERAALQWLREYMQTDAAKNAKSPFPGMVKEASLYVKPQALRVAAGEPVPIEVNAAMRTKSIQKIDFYVNDELVETMTEAPFALEYTPAEKGKYQLKAVLTADDGTTYERLSNITAFSQRSPHKGIVSLPGTLQFEDFDEGGEGFTFHDSDALDEGKANYRTDNEGVDIVTGNNGYALGYTATGEWLEYTVDVQQEGIYAFEAYASKGNDGNAGFTISLVTDGQNTKLASATITKTDDNQWSTYKKFTGTFSKSLPAGQQILRVTIDGPYINLDKMVLTCKTPTGIENVITLNEHVQRHNLAGQKVNASYKGVVIENGKKVVKK